MASFLLRPDESMLLVIDVQERLHKAMEQGMKDLSVKNTIILIEVARAYGIPLVVTEQYPKGLGKTISEIEAHIEDVPHREKLHFSCYRDDSIRSALDAQTRNTIIVAGIETHVCVLQTVLDLREAGYRVYVAGDAVSSRRAADRVMALDLMVQNGALVCSTETIAFMLMEKAGTETFKSLSAFFKE